MSNPQQEQNIEKYRELYEYSRDLHFKQIERANRIDQKAAMFLSALTVLIGFAGFFLKATFEVAIPAEGSMDYAFLGLTFLSCVTLVGSWFSFLSVLRVRKSENLRLDSEMLDFFRSNRRIDVHYAISKRASEAFSANDVHIAAKLRRLTFGYLLAILGLFLLAGSLVMFGCMKWVSPDHKPHEPTCKLSLINVNEQGRKNMPKETEGRAEQQPAGSSSQHSQLGGGEQLPIDQPNTDVQAPTNVIQTEALDYSRITTRDAGPSDKKSE